jgi:hypothetical protein
MAMAPEGPQVPGSPGTPGARGTAAWFAISLAGSAVLGLVGGLIWGEFAPRALYQEVSAGTAKLVNVETRAFFGADVWFAAIAVVAGLLTGILGYRFALSRRDGIGRAVVALALILGAVAGGLVMLWAGERIGLSSYQHHLESSADGVQFSYSLALGAKSALGLWPLCTSAVLLVAEWGTRPAREPLPPEPLPPESFSPEPLPPAPPA